MNACHRFVIISYQYMATNSSAGNPKGVHIPCPDKFMGEEDIEMWFQQFQIFLQLSEVVESQKASLLLVYLGPQVFQAVVTAIPEAKRTYDNIRLFLLDRYSTIDIYLDHLQFFQTPFNGNIESFAAALNKHMIMFQMTKSYERNCWLRNLLAVCREEHKRN